MNRTFAFIASHPLTRRRRAAAFLRLLRWQIVARLGSGAMTVPFAGGTRLALRPGMTGATGNWYCGLHEPGEMGFVLHVLRPGDLFVDAGANVGSYTVLAAGAAGADAVAFEPIPSTFAALERHVALNGLAARVACHNLGLGAAEDTLRFTRNRDTINHVMAAGEAGPSVDVPVRRLDDMLQGRVPLVVKIDVEGWEAQVLAGMPLTLADPRLAAIIMETNGSGDRYGAGGERETLLAAGFREHGYDAIARRLTDGGSSHNTIFIRDLDLVTARIATAGRTTLVTGDI